MINAIELIAHVPLFTIRMPSNAKFLFSMIMGVLGFDFLPDGTLIEFFGFEHSEEYNDDFDLMDIFEIPFSFFIIILNSLHDMKHLIALKI